ncbi:solute carrier family 35 member C2 isoform X2 [Scaptodrosophila lebanonensis]|uniref:Solute carrier family 35 member C2 isoform X2 n=1 Tax=Drosophila lebanonensis TaxID=7225 RepID=A0A6J2U9J6_DROLE|nr:solute carrier family 35 member C2 isoform X2 [Scaptodrosophila lebanonensis]
MVMPKYERLSTNESTSALSASASVSGVDDEDCEEIELGLDSERNKLPASTQNGSAHKDRRVLPTHANFQYINNSSSSGGGSHNNNKLSAQDQNPLADSTMSRHADARFMQMAIGTLVTVLVYLTLSITLTFYQKDIIKKLKFPLTIVTYHLIVKFMLASMVRSLYKLRVGKSRVQLDWRVALRKMAPTGIASGIDIGFSNWGLELVPISLYTMTKSSTIVFILLFAILLGLERKSWYLVFVVGLIAAGLFMFTYKSTQFNALGFFFLLFASLSSGVRWTFAQFIMQKSKLGLHNPVDMIFHMQPWMIVSLLPFLVGFEGKLLYDVVLNLKHVSNDVIVETIAKISIGAVLAFLMEVMEFLVLSKTSSLTLSIAGIFKDICQLALAIELNDDQLSFINVVGLVVCLIGIMCHLLHKYSTMGKADKQQQALQRDNDEDEEEDIANEFKFNEGNVIVGSHGAGGAGGHSTLTVPLLEQTDSEEDSGFRILRWVLRENRLRKIKI